MPLGKNDSSVINRLKFRVSSVIEPKWSEKWGVSLSPGEEFHVTDKLLKLPFQENPPKTVCTFSITAGGLSFQHLDLDRVVTLNGVAKRECMPKVGDKIKIGETIVLEIVTAPIAKSLVKAEDQEGPSISETIGREEPTNPAIATEGPTLTMTMSAQVLPVPSIHKDMSGSLEIPEPSLSSIKNHEIPELESKPDVKEARPAPTAYKPQPMTSGPFKVGPVLAEPKVELAKSPHAHRDPSLDGADEVTEEEIVPAPKPWIPDAFSAGARLRGRALVFLVAAAGTLMLAMGAMKIFDQIQGTSSSARVEAAKAQEYSKGIPIEFIEEKVRRMKRRR